MNNNRIKNILVLIWLYLLIAIAGAINVYALKVFFMPLTHHSGTLSNASLAFFNNLSSSLYLIKICLCFILGSCISGWFYHQRESLFNHKHLYFMLVAILVFISINFIVSDLRPYMISLWMGLQNGMYLTYSGQRVRITHVSGTLSDIGFTLGCLMRGHKHELNSFFYLLFKVIFFFIGGLFSYQFILPFKYPYLIIASIYFIAFTYYLLLHLKYHGFSKTHN